MLTVRIVNYPTFVLLSLYYSQNLPELAPLHSSWLESSRNETVLANQLIISMHLWLGHAEFQDSTSRQCQHTKSQHIAARSHTRSLHSSSIPLLQTTFSRTSFGKRAFSTAAPSTWNSLPESVLDTDSVAVFKSKLKTHLFTVAYSWL